MTKWAIARPINGISINGDEYLCDENGKMLVFNSEDEAVGLMNRMVYDKTGVYVKEIEEGDDANA